MNAALNTIADNREILYRQLLGNSPTCPNRDWLACILASWALGKSAMPDYLGLPSAAFQQLVDSYFPDRPLSDFKPTGKTADFSRMLEKDDLQQLLMRYARDDSEQTQSIAAIIVTACLGDDHLWQDLGLWNRAQLTQLLRYNFAELAEKNSHDMKWKKFIYKQLCEAEGLFVCRAPSCGVCIDYQKCYGSEE
jgi:nitrogen fixation protein NifQ